MIKVAPSILSADFAAMGRDVEMLEKIGSDYIHCDVMDGVYVSNITFGPSMIKALRSHTKLPMDVHLMITQPEKYIDAFADAGADIITFHPDATVHPHRVLQNIKKLNKKGGIVLNPGMSVVSVEHLLELCDIVLLMSVNPGFGGQAFIPGTLKKARELTAIKAQEQLCFEIEIDGGINEQTAKEAINAGVNVLVAGNSIFSSADPAAMVRAIRGEK